MKILKGYFTNVFSVFFPAYNQYDYKQNQNLMKSSAE